MAHALLTAYIGNTRDRQGYVDMNLHLLQRSLENLRTLLPRDHPEIALRLRELSSLHGRMGHAGDAEAAASAAREIERRSQVACAGPDCKRQLREDGAPLDMCVKCRRTFYCGKACQTADWKAAVGGHKAECKALVAEGKAAAGAGK